MVLHVIEWMLLLDGVEKRHGSLPPCFIIFLRK